VLAEQHGSRDGGGARGETEPGLVEVEFHGDDLAEVPVQAKPEGGRFVGIARRGGEARKRRIIDLQVGVAPDDFEGAPGSRGGLKIVLGVTPLKDESSPVST